MRAKLSPEQPHGTKLQDEVPPPPKIIAEVRAKQSPEQPQEAKQQEEQLNRESSRHEC